MAVLAAVLGVAVVAAATVAVWAGRRAGRHERERDHARARVTALEAELATARDTAAKESERATAAERAARDASEEHLRAELRATGLAEELAGAQAAAALDVDALWGMELQRSERTWRWSVAPDPLGAAPLAEAADPLRAAVEIEAAAWREEAGTQVDVEWDLPPDLPAAGRLLALRRVQEDLARVAKGAEHAVVRGRLDRGAVHVEVEVKPEAP